MRLLAAVVLALLLGCRDGSPPANPQAEARAFAETLARDVIPTCLPATVQARMHQGTRHSTDMPVLARLLCEWLDGIHSYKFVGFRNRKVEPGDSPFPHPIMRRLRLDKDTGAMFVVYDELVLVRPEGSKELRLDDVFSFRQAVWLGDLVDANKSGVGPTDYLGDASKHEAVQQAQIQLRAGDREGAIKAIDALDVAAQGHRSVQIMRIRAAVGTGGDTYKQALARITERYPDDPAYALVMIDGALDTDDFAGAIHWVDVLETAIGVDAFLECSRVIALTRKGDFDVALAAANNAIALEPTLTRALEIKLDVLIVKKQWADVLAVMSELETNHGTTFDIDKLRREPRLGELVSSPAFADWANAQRMRKQTQTPAPPP